MNHSEIKHCQNEVRFLDMVINEKEKVALSEKKREIQKFEKPICLKQPRGFLGSVVRFRGFIQNFSHKTRNLTNGLKNIKQFYWNESIDDEFIKIKA